MESNREKKSVEEIKDTHGKVEELHPKKSEEGTQHITQQWESTFNAISDWIVLTDINGRILRSNLAGENFTGRPLTEIVGRTCCKLVHGSDKHLTGCPLMKMLQTGQRTSVELHFKSTDRWLMVTVDPVKDQKGNLIGSVHITRDITSQKKAEKQLRESEARYKELFEQCPLGLGIGTADGKLIQINKTTEVITGYFEQELKKINLIELYENPQDRKKLLETIERYGCAVDFPARLKRKDGTVYDVLLNVSRVNIDGRELLQTLCMDVTERKKAQDALRQQKEVLQTILDNIPVMTAFLDANGKHKWVNQAWQNTMGWSLEEAQTRDVLKEFYPDPEYYKYVVNFIGGAESKWGDFKTHRRDGTVLETTWTNVPLSDGSNIGIGLDITERKRTEEAYRSLVDHSLQGLVIFQDESVIFTNKAMAEITGYTVEEMLSMEEVKAFVHPEDRELVWSRHRARLKGEKLPEQYEFRGIRKDGSICWLEIHASRIEYQGKPAIQAAYIDITERKKVEEALRESEERFRDLYENAVTGLYRTTPDGRILMANPALIRMLGYSNFEELSERNLEETGFEPGYSRLVFKERIEKEGQVVGLESAWIKKDGTSLYIRESAKAIRDNQGNTLYYEGTVEDVTECKKTQDALRESEQSYRRLIDTSQEGIWIVDTSAKTSYVNQQTAEMLGYSRQEMLGRSLFDFMDEQASIEARRLFEQRKNGIGEQHDFRFRHKNSSDVWTIVNTNPIYDDKGRFSGALAMITDITERKRAEDAMRSSEEKYRDLFENAREAIVTTDLNGKITNVNRRIEEYGFKRTKMMGKKLFDFVPEYDKARAISDFEIIIAGNPLKGEMDVITPKGIIKAEYSDNPIAQNGEIVGIQAILTDITERKRTEETLKASEKKFRTLFESTREGLVTADPEGRIISANPAAARILGYIKPEDLLGLYTAEFYSDQQQRKELLTELTEKGYIEDFEITVKKRDGSNAHILLSITIQKDKVGNVLCSNGIFRDVTERRHAQEKIASLAKFPAENPNPVMRVSKDCTILYANRASSVVLETLGKKAGERLPQECCEHVEEALRSGKISTFEFACNDGRLFEVTLVPVVESGYVNLYGLDITEHKKAIEQIEKLARFPAEDPNPVLRVTGYGTVVYANKSSEPLLKLWQCSVGGTLSGLWYDFVLDALSCGQNQQTEIQCGEQIFLVTFAPVMDSNYVNIYGSDITERKKAEQTLKASEERFKVLFESAPDGIYLTDLEGRFIDGNKAAEELTGYRREELIGKNFAESNLLSAEDLAKAVSNLKKAAHGESTGTQEYTLKRKNGTQVIVEIRTYPIKIGNKIMSMGIARDITKRKKDEERLLAYQKQLKNLASQLSLTEERERRYIGEGLHDDIIQPLAFLDIKMDSLKKTISDPDLIESCNEMQKTIHELIKTTRAFTFDLSFPVLYELGLEAALEEWLATNIRQKHKIETIFEDDGESKPLDDDMRASLFKAVKELLVNVVKHSKADNVKVSVARREDKIQIRVEDDGIGFHHVEKKDISGYGLFHIHERLDHLGGSFNIESEPGKGTRATLTAPLKP